MLELVLAVALSATPTPVPTVEQGAITRPDQVVPEAFGHFQLILHVADIRRSVNFYCGVLGFKLEHFIVGSAREVTELNQADGEPYGASVSAGDTIIGLMRDERIKVRGSKARLCFQVEHPAALHARLAAHGAKFYTEAPMRDGTPAVFSVLDPDGFWLFFTPAAAK